MTVTFDVPRTLLSSVILPLAPMVMPSILPLLLSLSPLLSPLIMTSVSPAVSLVPSEVMTLSLAVQPERVALLMVTLVPLTLQTSPVPPGVYSAAEARPSV